MDGDIVSNAIGSFLASTLGTYANGVYRKKMLDEQLKRQRALREEQRKAAWQDKQRLVEMENLLKKANAGDAFAADRLVSEYGLDPGVPVGVNPKTAQNIYESTHYANMQKPFVYSGQEENGLIPGHTYEPINAPYSDFAEQFKPPLPQKTQAEIEAEQALADYRKSKIQQDEKYTQEKLKTEKFKQKNYQSLINSRIAKLQSLEDKAKNGKNIGDIKSIQAAMKGINDMLSDPSYYKYVETGEVDSNGNPKLMPVLDKENPEVIRLLNEYQKYQKYIEEIVNKRNKDIINSGQKTRKLNGWKHY